MRTYEVELLISGPITTARSFTFDTDKELDIGNIFRSSISIKKHQQGVQILTTVFTVDQDRAYKVALLFIGKMLDVLAIKTNMPLMVSLNDRLVVKENIVRALLSVEELRICFELSRQLNLNETRLLRALNWYRKGLYTEDPFDKFLAFWNSINVLAAAYHNDNQRTRQGIINQIWDCFIALWGEDCNNWQFIQGDNRWVNDNNEIRNNIAHGAVSVEINYVEQVISRIDAVQKVAYKFITEWADQRLHTPLI